MESLRYTCLKITRTRVWTYVDFQLDVCQSDKDTFRVDRSVRTTEKCTKFNADTAIFYSNADLILIWIEQDGLF